jgi:hypothetical protein
MTSYFGVDPGVLGFTAQDYALRSADTLFIPAGAVLTAALAAAWLHSLIVRRLRAHPHRYAHVPPMLIVVGTGLFVLGVTAAWQGLPFATPFLFPQLSPGLGIGLLAYGLSLRRYRLHLENHQRAGPPEAGRNGRLLSTMFVVMLVSLSLFWATFDYAKALGTGRAETLAGQLGHLPGVVLDVRERLHIDGFGVTEQDLGDPGSTYRYRYHSLRLIFATAEAYVLVPADWTRESGVAIVLPRAQSLHLEFSTVGLR